MLLNNNDYNINSLTLYKIMFLIFHRYYEENFHSDTTRNGIPGKL